MHRSAAWLLIPAILAMSGAVSWLHTHAYNDHDHPEHHHGWSTHEHYLAPAATEAATAHLKSCDPGTHTVSFAFVCAAPPQVLAADLDLTLPATPRPQIRIAHRVRPADVRVHGPPPRTQASPRAPPPITPA